MMYQNTEHPDYDLEMELLATIPPEPGCVSLKALCADFGMTKLEEIYSLIRSINKGRKILVTANNNSVDDGNGKTKPKASKDAKSRGCRVVFVSATEWAHAKKRATEYWERVYKTTPA